MLVEEVGSELSRVSMVAHKVELNWTDIIGVMCIQSNMHGAATLIPADVASRCYRPREVDR